MIRRGRRGPAPPRGGSCPFYPVRTLRGGATPPVAFVGSNPTRPTMKIMLVMSILLALAALYAGLQLPSRVAGINARCDAAVEWELENITLQYPEPPRNAPRLARELAEQRGRCPQ